MKNTNRSGSARWAVVAVIFTFLAFLPAAAGPVGPFSDHQDIGTAAPSPGAATFDDATKTLTLSAGGANIWAARDDFHFAWKKVSGDMSLAATLEWVASGAGAVDHRKVVLMIRQTLDIDSPYADASIHGNGMTALQWRETKGGPSAQIQMNVDMPKRIRIEKRGSYFSMSTGTKDDDMQPSGGAMKIEWEGEFYIGIGICSHSATRTETAKLSDISIAPTTTGEGRAIINTLEVYQVGANRDRKVVWVQTQPRRFEAPNWAKDDSNLLYFNNGGKLYSIKAILPNNSPTSNVNQRPPEQLDLGILTNINNDHIFSPDGKMFGISDQSTGASKGQSTVWTIPVGGAKAGEPKKITAVTPSYLHGWSPDGKTLAYASRRANNWDIYTMASDGTGEEKRLTTDPGLDDGPEYSPDGKYIYFNSSRAGLCQIWRMKPDGTEPEQLTNDEFNNWFPHISPNGQQMVFISFDKTIKPEEHPENKDVTLRIMNLSTKQITVAAKLFGGQGTINVPSWSPDSRFFAFVSYQQITK